MGSCLHLICFTLGLYEAAIWIGRTISSVLGEWIAVLLGTKYGMLLLSGLLLITDGLVALIQRDTRG